MPSTTQFVPLGVGWKKLRKRLVIGPIQKIKALFVLRARLRLILLARGTVQRIRSAIVVGQIE
jgi:hypothetical protein